MRVKVRFIADVAQPPLFVDLRWLPRPGETVEVAFRKRIQVVEVVRIENDKRCEAMVRGKLMEPVRQPEANLPVVAPQSAPSPLASKSIQEIFALYQQGLGGAAPA